MICGSVHFLCDSWAYCNKQPCAHGLPSWGWDRDWGADPWDRGETHVWDKAESDVSKAQHETTVRYQDQGHILLGIYGYPCLLRDVFSDVTVTLCVSLGGKIHTHPQLFYGSGFCLGQPRWAGTRRNIHPLKPSMVINHPLSASSIYYDP